MHIILLGSGNVANVLGHKMKEAGHQISAVFGRNREKVKLLSLKLGATPIFGWNDISSEADLYIIALPDQIIPQVHQYFNVKKGLVVHTAGSVSIETLSRIGNNYGVLYPLQSLKADISLHSIIPFLVDGNTIEDKTLLADFASTLSTKVQYANDAERLRIHLAAVMVSNFSNHLYTLTNDFCDRNSIEFKLLIPLIQETANRLEQFAPNQVQTGPAIRSDHKTIEKHLQLLKSDAALSQLYMYLSDSIENYYQNHRNRE